MPNDGAAGPRSPRLACTRCAAFAPRVLRRFALVLLLAVALPARAQQPFDIRSDGTSTFDLATGESIFTQNVRLTDGSLLLTADEVRSNEKTGVASAHGHVVFTRGAVRLLADHLVYHRADGTFTAEKVRLGDYPYYAEGDTAAGTREEIALTHATVTYGEPGPWQPTLKADKVIYAPGQRLRTENSQAGIGQVQPVPLPKFQQDLKQSLISDVSLTGGYRSSLGAFVDTALHVPVAPGFFLGADAGVYTARGVMFGPAGNYSNASGDLDLRGFFRTGYINDHGDKKTDLLGHAVPENRAFAEWQHQQTLAENLTLDAQLNWWKDSEVVRDFRPRAFFPVQEPDTFIESTYAGANYFVSAFARFQPNSFQRVQERLPEIRFDLLPTSIGGGVVEQFNASYVRLRERGPLETILSNLTVNVPGQPVTPSSSSVLYGPNVTLLQADRFDAYYALSRPIAPTEWFSITPVAGGRLASYADARFGPVLGIVPAPAVDPSPRLHQTRTLGEVGFDAVLRSSGTFAYQNETWKIDGLRHLFTPRISYRYIRANEPNLMPAIDRPVFSTYLQPLGLGDARTVDTMDSANTLRLAFDNVLQTHDPVTGTRDLALLTIANDFNFAAGHRDLSGLQVEAALMPVHWLQLDAYQRYAPRTARLQEFNTGFTLHDGDAWSVRFSNNFLRDQIEDYAVDGRARINEVYQLLTRLHYDARKRRFNEQAYGLVQNLDNTWRISYVVSLYAGPRRESHFGLNVQIEATGF